ncbi:hypothetical protein NPIL_616211 [Nephila pilipes]|uniref:Uncharacterized protein n=1 Tax=Nephila pilipes TaxID=299642 RepID=A0A8X6R4E5_NEPPI|nr:hypothetical protein NPIL_103211 [Nephila pilipes]GFU60746.1 hypothetical protein NPIL_616211 [Nephila pilipes]
MGAITKDFSSCVEGRREVHELGRRTGKTIEFQTSDYLRIDEDTSLVKICATRLRSKFLINQKAVQKLFSDSYVSLNFKDLP